jgi:protein involved in polysaccharide export with SLBB domain
VIQNLDVYDYLTKGSMEGNTVLRDQDVIRVPAYDIRVSLTGEVKSEGLFEMLKGETVENLLGYAGGFSDSAFTASITAYKATDVERRIVDISKDEFGVYQPSRSESFVVKKLVNRFTNRVSITGAVYLPGDFELEENLTLRDLMLKAQGLTENAFTDRAVIVRYGENMIANFISFNPKEVMNNIGNITLKRNDEVRISSINELREDLSVTIAGEVRNTGTYQYYENMSLRDLVLKAGGFTYAAIPQKIEIGRRLKKDSFNVADIEIAQVININSVEDLKSNNNDIKLEPFDVITIRRNPSYNSQANIKVEGEVVFPGAYVLGSKNERISDVLKRAGGITAYAYKQGGYLSRLNRKSVVNQLTSDKVEKIQGSLKDSTAQVQQDLIRPVDQIAINLAAILAQAGAKEDLIVEDGDIITIPKERIEVRVSGEVLFPTRVIHQDNMDLKDYIGRAGGFTDNSRKRRVYILYPNGNAAKTSSFLFYKKYPKVLPGSEIIVPIKQIVERRRLSTAEVIGITGALTAIGGVLIQLLR